MMTDARFEDGAESPLRLQAQDPEELKILAALLQDAVGTVAEISWMPRRREIAMLVSRVRWEDERTRGPSPEAAERVRTLVLFSGVTGFRSQGLDPRDKDTVFAILTMTLEDARDGGGCLHLTLAGDGALLMDVECIDLRLKDVARPHEAVAKRLPSHPDDDA